MTVRCIMKFILDNLEESDGFIGLGIIIYACGIKVKDLPIKNLFGGADIPDSIQQFFPIHSAAIPLEPFIVHGETFDDIFVESLRSPLAKAGTNDGMNTIAYGNDDIKVVTKDLMNLSFPLYGSVWSGYSEFPNNH